MKKISVCVNSYPGSNKYLPLLLVLGEHLENFYGQGMPRGKALPDELKGKIKSSKIPSRLTRIIRPICVFFHLPKYYLFWFQVRLLDYMMSRKVNRDNSDILYANPLFSRTVRKAKLAGKVIVIEAANSEPYREHQRIRNEYKEFGIKKIYIYGNPIFRDTCIETLSLADKIINISKVSQNTYIDAGYSKEKLVLVPMTGTDFPLQKTDIPVGLEKAFITTAFHNFIKGTHRLLLAWRKSAIKDIPLIVVGALGEDMEEFIKEYGPFDNVIFTGINHNLKDFYSTRDAVGVLLSLSEGAGRVTPEMMSYGFPMIVSRDATCDLVHDGINGFIVDSTDVNAIANKLCWFTEDWSRVHSMRKTVIESVSRRSMEDWSKDVGAYLLSL